MCGYNQAFTYDLQFISVPGNRFSHNLFPCIFYLHGLDVPLYTAFIQVLLNRTFDRVFRHNSEGNEDWG